MTDATATTRRTRPPAPASISEQAQQALNAAPPLEETPELDLDDTQGWLRYIEAREAPGRELLAPFVPPEDRLARNQVQLGGVTIYVLRPNDVSDDREAPIFLELHGGSLIFGGGDLAWMMAAGKAANRIGTTWVADYRMPPVHPTPPRWRTASPSTATPSPSAHPARSSSAGRRRAQTWPRRWCCTPKTKACRCPQHSCC
jgi:acetyl esterase/lipase